MGCEYEDFKNEKTWILNCSWKSYQLLTGKVWYCLIPKQKHINIWTSEQKPKKNSLGVISVSSSLSVNVPSCCEGYLHTIINSTRDFNGFSSLSRHLMLILLTFQEICQTSLKTNALMHQIISSFHLVFPWRSTSQIFPSAFIIPNCWPSLWHSSDHGTLYLLLTKSCVKSSTWRLKDVLHFIFTTTTQK